MTTKIQRRQGTDFAPLRQGFSMPPERSPSAMASDVLQAKRLAAGHGGRQAGAEHRPGRTAGNMAIGDCGAIVAC
jgi:hypothetical protein